MSVLAWGVSPQPVASFVFEMKTQVSASIFTALSSLCLCAPSAFCLLDGCLSLDLRPTLAQNDLIKRPEILGRHIFWGVTIQSILSILWKGRVKSPSAVESSDKHDVTWVTEASINSGGFYCLHSPVIRCNEMAFYLRDLRPEVPNPR